VRRAVAQVEDDLPVPALRTQTDLLAQANARERVFAQLLTIFGIFALALTTIGLHGITSYSVSRRTSEIGVRIALGASVKSVSSTVLRSGLSLVLTGLVVGVPGGYVAGRLIQGMLFGVGAADPVNFLVVAAFLSTVATVACVLPARRAARVDPVEAFRSE